MSCKENKDETRAQGKEALCEIAAHNIKKTIMRNVKEAESDIASACAIFHKRHELKTGKPITTISEFEKVTQEFSRLPKSEIAELIIEGKEEDRKAYEDLKKLWKK